MELPTPFDVLIVDDGSPDGTGAIVKNLQTEAFPKRLHLIERQGKLGLGTAYIRGFEWALEQGYQYICEMDADFSHNPKDLVRLQATCTDPEVQLVVGSRYMKGGKLKDWPWLRVLISKGASLYVRLITWMPVADPTAGFVCYHRSLLEALDFSKIRFIGYAFQIEMKFASWLLHFKLKEIPITFVDRQKGHSKMSIRIFREAFLGVLKMRWHSFFGSYGKKRQ